MLQNGVKAWCFAHMLPCTMILSECFQAHRQLIKVSWDYGYLSGRKCSQMSIVSAQSSCFNFKTISVTDFNSPRITNLCFSWPNRLIMDIVIASGNPSQGKCFNGPDRSCLCERSQLMLSTPKIALKCSFGDAVSMCRWPNYSQRRSVHRCLCAWKCSDRIIVHVCKTSCLYHIL